MSRVQRPRCRQTAGTVKKPQPAAATPGMDICELTLCVVEPSPVQRKLIDAELNKLGLTKIRYDDSGHAALESMATSLPDLVVSAMYLPDMTGAELVRAMRHDRRLESVPFMLISSETSFKMLDPVRQAGVVAILPKPFCLEDLRRALYSTVEFITPDEQALADIVVHDLKALVVDDSSLARRHIVRVLNNLGIQDISAAENGLQALEIIESSFFDFVVTDYNMPEMDGENLVRCIRSHSAQRSIPILMVTSEGDESRLAAVQRAGVSGICDKPFDSASVKFMIRQLLAS
jgi:two-component system chemotaxis response regulator CheY